jgi:hypothetical protein
MFRAMPPRVDLVALHAPEYTAGRVPRVVATAPARYLSLDGEGDVAGAAFLEHALALQRILRELRARARREDGKDFTLPPVEALVGPARAQVTTAAGARAGGGSWKLLLRVPAFVRTSDLAGLAEEQDGEWDALRAARIEEIQEGRCIQALHVGPFETVPATVDRLRRAAADADLEVRGRLHQVWLSAPGRTTPERRRTVVRLPVKAR